ncbi:hypothetical protein H4219_001090 [Mycoemilia scoparia]|uniref:Cep57 centrosome microtubule-binding domain-containing protein n=1 Tax=Mycoemilia scoparia TaxID=417184 RepID=A0A9W8DWK4_9FUNG|nr:hypothetical protein H4219_001090 [Mycoemilia scoparia]
MSSQLALQGQRGYAFPSIDTYDHQDKQHKNFDAPGRGEGPSNSQAEFSSRTGKMVIEQGDRLEAELSDSLNGINLNQSENFSAAEQHNFAAGSMIGNNNPSLEWAHNSPVIYDDNTANHEKEDDGDDIESIGEITSDILNNAGHEEDEDEEQQQQIHTAGSVRRGSEESLKHLRGGIQLSPSPQMASFDMAITGERKMSPSNKKHVRKRSLEDSSRLTDIHFDDAAGLSEKLSFGGDESVDNGVNPDGIDGFSFYTDTKSSNAPLQEETHIKNIHTEFTETISYFPQPLKSGASADSGHPYHDSDDCDADNNNGRVSQDLLNVPRLQYTGQSRYRDRELQNQPNFQSMKSNKGHNTFAIDTGIRSDLSDSHINMGSQDSYASSNGDAQNMDDDHGRQDIKELDSLEPPKRDFENVYSTWSPNSQSSPQNQNSIKLNHRSQTNSYSNYYMTPEAVRNHSNDLNGDDDDTFERRSMGDVFPGFDQGDMTDESIISYQQSQSHHKNQDYIKDATVSSISWTARKHSLDSENGYFINDNFSPQKQDVADLYDSQFRPINNPDDLFGSKASSQDTDKDHEIVFGDLINRKKDRNRGYSSSASNPSSFHRLGTDSVTESVVKEQLRWENNEDDPLGKYGRVNSLGVCEDEDISGVLKTPRFGETLFETAINGFGTPDQYLISAPTTPATIFTRGIDRDPRRRKPEKAAPFSNRNSYTPQPRMLSSQVSPATMPSSEKLGTRALQNRNQIDFRDRHQNDSESRMADDEHNSGYERSDMNRQFAKKPLAKPQFHYISSPLGKRVATPSALNSAEGSPQPQSSCFPQKNGHGGGGEDSLNLGSLLNNSGSYHISRISQPNHNFDSSVPQSPTGSSASWLQSRVGLGRNFSPLRGEVSGISSPSNTGNYIPFQDPTIDFNDLPNYKNLDLRLQKPKENIPTSPLAKYQSPGQRSMAISQNHRNVHQQLVHNPSYETEPTMPYSSSQDGSVDGGGGSVRGGDIETMLPESLVRRQKSIANRKFENQSGITSDTLSPDHKLLQLKLRQLKPLMEKIASGQTDGNEHIESIMEYLSPHNDNVYGEEELQQEGDEEDQYSQPESGSDEHSAVQTPQHSKQPSSLWSSRISWKSVKSSAQNHQSVERSATPSEQRYPDSAYSEKPGFPNTPPQNSLPKTPQLQSGLFRRPSAPTPSRALGPLPKNQFVYRPLPPKPVVHASRSNPPQPPTPPSLPPQQETEYTESHYGVNGEQQMEFNHNTMGIAGNEQEEEVCDLASQSQEQISGAGEFRPPESIFDETVEHIVSGEEQSTSPEATKLHSEVAQFMRILTEQRDEMSKQMDELRTLSRAILEKASQQQQQLHLQHQQQLLHQNPKPSSNSIAVGTSPFPKDRNVSASQQPNPRASGNGNSDEQDPFIQPTNPANKTFQRILQGGSTSTRTPPAMRQVLRSVNTDPVLSKHQRTSQWVNSSAVDLPKYRPQSPSVVQRQKQEAQQAGREEKNISAQTEQFVVKPTQTSTLSKKARSTPHRKLRHDANVWTTPSLQRSHTMSTPISRQHQQQFQHRRFDTPSEKGSVQRSMSHRGSVSSRAQLAKKPLDSSRRSTPRQSVHHSSPLVQSQYFSNIVDGIEDDQVAEDNVQSPVPMEDEVQMQDTSYYEDNHEEDQENVREIEETESNNSESTITVPESLLNKAYYTNSDETEDRTYADEHNATKAYKKAHHSPLNVPTKCHASKLKSRRSSTKGSKFHLETIPKNDNVKKQKNKQSIMEQLQTIIDTLRDDHEANFHQHEKKPKSTIQKCPVCKSLREIPHSLPKSVGNMAAGVYGNNHDDEEEPFEVRDDGSDYSYDPHSARRSSGPVPRPLFSHQRKQSSSEKASKELAAYLQDYIKALESQVHNDVVGDDNEPNPPEPRTNHRESRAREEQSSISNARARWQNWLNRFDSDLQPAEILPPPPSYEQVRAQDRYNRTRKQPHGSYTNKGSSSSSANKVIEMLRDELVILKRRYHELTSAFEEMDPTDKSNERHRRVLASEIRDLVDLINMKGEQINTLNDLQEPQQQQQQKASYSYDYHPSNYKPYPHHDNKKEGGSQSQLNKKLLKSAKALQDVLYQETIR